MKIVKWKVLIITSIVCLLPILLGLSLWKELPEIMAIHFNFYGEPDGFASKGFVVFGLPVLMVLLQTFCCIVSDINASRHGETKKFERVVKWIIPAISVILYIATLGYGLGWAVDIRKVVAFVLGGELVVIGNYLPKLDYIKNYNIDREKAKKINRFTGIGTFALGIIILASIFMPPAATIISICLVIPYAISTVIYALVVIKKK